MGQAVAFRESPEFLRGRDAEQRVARVFQQRGWFVIPSYDYCGEDGNKAPKAQGVSDGIILPDLGIAQRGIMKWVEVKAKSCPTFTIKAHSYDHGIGLRKWTHYKRCQHETGCHVFLCIIEENSQMLLLERLDTLGEGRTYTGNKMDAGGMIFWPRLKFGIRIKLDSIPGLFDEKKKLPFEE